MGTRGAVSAGTSSACSFWSFGLMYLHLRHQVAIQSTTHVSWNETRFLWERRGGAGAG